MEYGNNNAKLYSLGRTLYWVVVYNVNPSGGNTGRTVCGCYTSARVSAVLNKIDGNHSANSNNNDKDCFSVILVSFIAKPCR